MTCPECKGVGVVLVEELRLLPQQYARFSEPDYIEREIECETCGGLGEED